MKYMKATHVVTWSQGMLGARAGDSFDDEHPLVSERPDLFTDVEPGAEHRAPGRVQSTMQAPGESRMERTPVKPVVQAPPRKPNNGA